MGPVCIIPYCCEKGLMGSGPYHGLKRGGGGGGGGGGGEGGPRFQLSILYYVVSAQNNVQ